MLQSILERIKNVHNIYILNVLRRLVHFHIATHYIKIDKTSLTYSRYWESLEYKVNLSIRRFVDCGVMLEVSLNNSFTRGPNLHLVVVIPWIQEDNINVLIFEKGVRDAEKKIIENKPQLIHKDRLPSNLWLYLNCHFTAFGITHKNEKPEKWYHKIY